jgi:pilus assembly protein FimV
LRSRSTAIFVSFLAVLLAPQSWGLGLGEIELNSALNQEFKATIELFDASGLEQSEILVSLGSNEDFQRIGVERFFFLTDLSFEVSHGPSGDPQITVSSRRPITEPYLNFLVEVRWPNGRLLKEYTVLLDPPTFSEAATPPVSAPQQDRGAASSGRVQRVQPADSGTRVQVAPTSQPPQPSALDRGLSGDEYGMTDRTDTLWSIASRARPSNAVSVQQTMLAIQQMNPEAFINENINLLKAGYVLRLPDEAQARALSAQEALGEVARHQAEWEAYNRGELVAERAQPAPAPRADQTSDLRSPVDASSATTSASAAPRTDGELRIVAEDGDSTTGVGNEAASAALDLALEETDRLGREVDELTYQLDREKELATNEVAIRERQIDVKDQQIAELQAQLAAARQAQQAQAAQPTPAPTPEPQNQNQSTPTEATVPWWQSPLVMYGGAGVLVLLLVGGMITARNRRAAEEENDYFDAEEAFADEERQEPVFDEATDEDFDDEGDLTDATRIAPTEEVFDEELEGSQTSDVIGEADIYIAYGRFPQAVGLLSGVLEDEPERNDVRMKLLEVFAETGDRSEFDTQMAALIENCEDEEALLAARDLEGQFGEEAIMLDGMMAEDSEDATTGEDRAIDDDRTVIAPPFALAASAADATDSDDTVLDVAAEAEEFEESKEADSPATDTSALDFELELDEVDESVSPETPVDEEDSEFAAIEAEGAGDQLGGDLGIDFDPDADTTDADTTQDADEGIDFMSTSTTDAEGQVDEEPEVAPISFEAPAEAEIDSADEEMATAEGASGFADTEELTIDADLEEAAASISSEAAELSSEGTDLDEGDLAVETRLETDDDTENLLDDLALETSTDTEEDFDFQDEGDSANTKLDLARAYIDMGDADGARDILKEVLDEGNSDQQQKAQSMLEAL